MTTFVSKLDALMAEENPTVKELSAWFADHIVQMAILVAGAEYNDRPHPPGGEKGIQAIDEAGLRAIDNFTEEIRRAARAVWPSRRQQALLEGLTLRAKPPTESKH